MKNESQIRILHLLRFLYQQTDEEHPASAADIVRCWEDAGIQASRKSVYHDIALLNEFGVDIVCVKSTQNRYFVGTRIFAFYQACVTRKIQTGQNRSAKHIIGGIRALLTSPRLAS